MLVIILTPIEIRSITTGHKQLSLYKSMLLQKQVFLDEFFETLLKNNLFYKKVVVLDKLFRTIVVVKDKISTSVT